MSIVYVVVNIISFHAIITCHFQIKLLKDGKEIPDELQAKLLSKQAKAEASPPTASDSKANISTNEEIELLKSKVSKIHAHTHTPFSSSLFIDIFQKIWKMNKYPCFEDKPAWLVNTNLAIIGD